MTDGRKAQFWAGRPEEAKYRRSEGRRQVHRPGIVGDDRLGSRQRTAQVEYAGQNLRRVRPSDTFAALTTRRRENHRQIPLGCNTLGQGIEVSEGPLLWGMLCMGKEHDQPSCSPRPHTHAPRRSRIPRFLGEIDRRNPFIPANRSRAGSIQIAVDHRPQGASYLEWRRRYQSGPT